MRKIGIFLLAALLAGTVPVSAQEQPPSIRFLSPGGNPVSMPLWGQELTAEADMGGTAADGVFLSLALYDKSEKSGKPSSKLVCCRASAQPAGGKLRAVLPLPDDAPERFEIKATLWNGFGNLEARSSAALLGSDDARLKRLKINGVEVDGFSPDVTEYELSEIGKLDADNPPQILATPMDGGAVVTPSIDFVKQKIELCVQPGKTDAEDKVYTLKVPIRVVKNYTHLYSDTNWKGGSTPAEIVTTGLLVNDPMYSDKPAVITSIDKNGAFNGPDFLKDYTVIRPAYGWIAENKGGEEALNPAWYGAEHVEWYSFTVDQDVEVMILSPQWQLPDWVYDFKWTRDPENPSVPIGKETNYSWEYPEGSKPGDRWTIDEWLAGIYAEGNGSQYTFMAKKIFTIPEGQSELTITMRSPGVPKFHTNGEYRYPPEMPKRHTPYIVLVKPAS